MLVVRVSSGKRSHYVCRFNVTDLVTDWVTVSVRVRVRLGFRG